VNVQHIVRSGLCALILQTAMPSAQVSVNVNLQQEGITIDGFGAFGAMIPWWFDGPFYNQAFLDCLIDSLGCTLMRTELYPTPEEDDLWTKQIPYWRALKAKADQSGEPFGLYGCCWTAPGRFKNTGETVGGWVDDASGYGRYLVDYVARVEQDLGFPLMAVGPTNEPALCTGYNSMCAGPAEVGELFIDVALEFRKAQCTVPIVCNDQIFSGGWVGETLETVEENPRADSLIKYTSMHYASNADDGNDLGVSRTLEWYEDVRAATQRRPWRKMWNTEFGGQFSSWENDRTKEDQYGDHPGCAWKLAVDYMCALKTDHSAIIYWQVCEEPHDDPVGDHYSMFYNNNGSLILGPLFYVSKTIFRQVRPGAIKVGCTSSNQNVWALAYHHKDQQTVTVLLLNMTNSPQSVSVSGSGLPSNFDIYQTSPDQNCLRTGTVAPGGTVQLPVKSLTALYNTPDGPFVRTTNPTVGLSSTPSALRGGHGSVFSINGRLVEGVDAAGLSGNRTSPNVCFVRTASGIIHRSVNIR